MEDQSDYLNNILARFEQSSQDIAAHFKDRPGNLLIVDSGKNDFRRTLLSFLARKLPHDYAPPKNIEKQRRFMKLIESSMPLIRTDLETKRATKTQSKTEFDSILKQSSLRYQEFGSEFAAAYFYPSALQYNLTISDEKKFVWFRVAKVGSRTILDLFRQANIELNAEHPLDVHYPVNRYQEYFKFAFVRNPWDRLVSCWHDKGINHNLFDIRDKGLGFEDFIDHIAEKVDLESGNIHLRLQSRLIDLNQIDFLGRFENFEKDLNRVMQLLGLEASFKERMPPIEIQTIENIIRIELETKLQCYTRKISEFLTINSKFWVAGIISKSWGTA